MATARPQGPPVDRVRWCLGCKTVGPSHGVCGQCRAVHYCGTRCQQLDWRQGHRRVCQPYAAALREFDRFDRRVDDFLHDTTIAALTNQPAPPAGTSSAIMDDFMGALVAFYFQGVQGATPLDAATLAIYAQHCHYVAGTCVGTLAKLLLLVTPADLQRPGFSWESVDNPILAACRGPGCVAAGKPGTKHAGACGHYFTQTL